LCDLLKYYICPKQQFPSIHYPSEITNEAGIIKLILDTCEHLHLYSPQLLSNKNPNENNYNQLFREMFNHAYGEMGVHCHDQEQTSSTGRVGKNGNLGISSLDLVLRTDGNPITIGEALILEDFDTGKIDSHIGKLIGSNIQNQPLLFLLIYGCMRDKESFWEKYQEHIKTSALYELQNIKNFDETEIYKEEVFDSHVNCMKILYSQTLFDGKTISVYHIFMDVQNQAHTDQAAKARE